MAPSKPSAAAHEFLTAHGETDAVIEALTGDASPRRYFRLKDRGLILMEDPRDPVGFASYSLVSAHLNVLGLSAPRVFHAQTSCGIALIEDFGDDTYSNLLTRGEDEGKLYRLAVDALLHLHHAENGADIGRPEFTLDYVLSEISLFPDWYAPAIAPTWTYPDFARSSWLFGQRPLNP